MANKRHSPKEDSEPKVNSVDPMASFVVEEFERYERGVTDIFEESQEVYDQWIGSPPSRAYSWQNQVHVPATFSAEQTISPRIFAALFPNEAPVDAKVYGGTTEEQGILIRGAIRHYFTVSDVQGKVISPISQCTLLGTGYVESPYLYRKKWQIGEGGERVEVLTDNRPDCKSVNFFEIYPHPAKLEMDDGLPLIRRRYCDAEYLKRLGDDPNLQFKNLKEALNTEEIVGTKSVILDDKGRHMDKKKRDEYELLEYWGPYDLNISKDGKVISTKKGVPHWIIVVNRKVVVRGIPNPYNHQMPPYCKFTLFQDTKPNWFGIGIGVVGKPTQDRLNKMVNQRLDNVDLVLNKQGFYNGNDPLINVKKLKVSIPGQWHKVSDTVNSIKWMDIPDVTASSYKEEELAKADFREATGATVPLMPADEGQHRTAAGINLLQGAAGMRFRPILRKMETDLIQQLSMFYLSNLQQFMVLPEWIRMNTPKDEEVVMQITPAQIQGKVMFIPMGVSETINKEVQVGQLLRFKEVVANDRTVNHQEINKRIGELMGFKDLKKLTIQQQAVKVGPGQLPPDVQNQIQQMKAQGMSNEQIKAALVQQGANQGGQTAGPVRGQTPEAGMAPQQPQIPV